MNSLKHLGLPIMAVGLKSGDEVLQTRQNGHMRTIYLKDNRVIGFQLIGDINAAGVLRALMMRRENIQPYKDRLLRSQFRSGHVGLGSCRTVRVKIVDINMRDVLECTLSCFFPFTELVLQREVALLMRIHCQG